MGATHGSIDELLRGATDREVLHPDDARSGATFERLRVDGRPSFLKVLSAADDWIMRVTGNLDHWELKVWRAGIYDRFPASIDHAIRAMVLDEAGAVTRLGILMEDCGGDLIPSGDATVTADEHRDFVNALADLHATFWGWTDSVGLCPLVNRLRMFAPETIASELLVHDVAGPIRAADAGWALLETKAEELWKLACALHADPAPVVDGLARTPVTFLSGDWKMGNLGHRSDGTTILLDQAFPGSGPACWDLLWYVALNRQRLPESKEATIERYRAALEGRGIDTAPWWDRQLALSTIALMACFGWEKALGDDEELGWWAERSLAAAAELR